MVGESLGEGEKGRWRDWEAVEGERREGTYVVAGR